MVSVGVNKEDGQQVEQEQIFVVAFTAEPGDFWLEGIVTYSNVKWTYAADEEIFRISRNSRRVKCITW